MPQTLHTPIFQRMKAQAQARLVALFIGLLLTGLQDIDITRYEGSGRI